MSPQQAKNLPPTAADDVYCLGATLFHCVFGRLPTEGETLGELWSKKENGVIDPLPKADLNRVPPPLVAIIMKALASEVEDRYRTPEEFARDLRHFQAGLAVSAYPETLWDYCLRTLKRNRGVALGMLVACTAVAVLASFLIWQYYQEHTGWGTPVVYEGFSTPVLSENWRVLEGDAFIQDGRLITTGPRGHKILYQRKFEGDVAISFDARILNDAPVGDISLIWYRDIQVEEKGRSGHIRGIDPIYFQLGAWDNAFARIKERSTVALARRHLEAGKAYHVRVEIEGRHLKLFQDHKLVCQYDRVFPLNGGYFALYAYYPGKVFDNVRVYQKHFAVKVRSTQVPDTYFSDGFYERALHYYDRIVHSHQNHAVTEYARYRKGLCYLMLGREQDAERVWRLLTRQEYLDAVSCRQLEQLFRQKKHDQVIRNLRLSWSKASASLRQQLIILWGVFFEDLVNHRRFSQAAQYLELRRELFPNAQLHNPILGRYFLRRGDYYRLLETLPNEPWACAQALYHLGLYKKLLKLYPNQRGPASLALVRLNQTATALQKFPERRSSILQELRRLRRWQEILDFFPDNPQAVTKALIGLGRYDEVLKRFPTQHDLCAMALLAKGSPQEALKYAQKPSRQRALALLRLGRFEEAFALRAYAPKVAFLAAQRMGKVKDCLKPENGFPDEIRIRSLMHLGEFSRVLKLFPNEEDLCVVALGHMGKYSEIIEQYPNTIWGPAWAYSMQQRWREALAAAPDNAWTHIDYLQAHGKHRQILEQYGNYARASAQALIYLGRYDDVLQFYPEQRDTCALALLFQKKVDEVIAKYQDLHDRVIEAEYLKQLIALRAGKEVPFTRKDIFSDEYVGYSGHAMFAHFLMPVVVRYLLKYRTRAETDQRLRQLAENNRYHFHQRLWAMLSLIQGKLSRSEFLNQPHQLFILSDFYLAKALEREFAQDLREARSYYTKYRELAPCHRIPDPVSWFFVDWRLEVLKK
ncbi:MAG: hypothetical protein D6820_13910 [Lentisphaerae bacterium]|nr:MAG: hypothetical protein D6820_13910 [Lentisphaerota bacterium]